MPGRSHLINRDRRGRRFQWRRAASLRCLKFLVRSPRMTVFERAQLALALDSLPMRTHTAQLRNLCLITGRPRGVFRRFRLSRHLIRRLALLGHLFGVRKSSW